MRGRGLRGSRLVAMVVLACSLVSVVVAACGGAKEVKPKAIAFEPTIVGCSGKPTECTSAAEPQLRESREARNHLCPADEPDVLIKADGALVCVATLPSAGPLRIGGISIPGTVSAHGAGAVATFNAGEAVVAASGCLACHRIGDAGNDGPGPELTHVASRLPRQGIARTLVNPTAPMPSFKNLPPKKFEAVVYFLSQLR